MVCVCVFVCAHSLPSNQYMHLPHDTDSEHFAMNPVTTLHWQLH